MIHLSVAGPSRLYKQKTLTHVMFWDLSRPLTIVMTDSINTFVKEVSAYIK